MRILAVGDEVSPALERAVLSPSFPKVDLILSCGDLPYDYLEFLLDAVDAPLLFVRGNHDRPIHSEDRVIQAPQGGVDVDGRIVERKGVIVVGFGGCARYDPRAENQYTEGQMRWRIRRLGPRLWWNARRRGRACDILLTHAPPFGVHDGTDPAHRGFEAFLWFIRRWQPRVHLHGHTPPRPGLPATTQIGPTQVVHVRGFRLLEL
ncbi:MAG: metallophosphoesterase [Candidatus Bipolaricaulaceae bacterium]